MPWVIILVIIAKVVAAFHILARSGVIFGRKNQRGNGTAKRVGVRGLHTVARIFIPYDGIDF